MEILNDIDNDKILHDDHFGQKPASAFLLTIRLALLCLMSGSFIMMICDMYDYTGDKWQLSFIAAAASGFVFILASLLPASLVYGGVILALAGVSWVMRRELLLKAQYFWDFMMLRLDSRLIDTSGQFIHSAARIKAGSARDAAEMEQAFYIAMLVLIVICAVMFCASVRTRFHLGAPVTAATLVTAPAIAAERAGYIPAFIMFVVCVFGFITITSSEELDMGFIYGHLPAARLSGHRSDMAYYKRTRFLLFGRKLKSDAERFHRYAANSVALALTAAVAFFGAAHFIPDGKGLNYKEVFEAIEQLSYQAADAVGGIFGTTFGTSDDRGYFSAGGYNDVASSISIAPPSNSNMPVLEVKLSRNDVPVYLRGDIGVDYHNGSWSGIKTVDGKYRAAVPEGFYPEHEYQMFRKYLAYTFSVDMPDEVLPLQMVALRYLRNTRVIFQPLAAYELNYRENEQYECFSDFILRTRRGFVKNYSTLSLTPNLDSYKDIIFAQGDGSPRYIPAYWADGHIDPPEGMTTEQYEKAIYGYRSYVGDTFMKSSPEIKKLADTLKIPETYTEFTGITNAYSGYYTCIIAQEMCDYFAENFTYSLDAPNGEDQLNGFLYDTHSGHCALFATAMTLALRDYGIPARYITGYVVEGPGELQPDGTYKYVLTEKQLHAWVEAYIPEIGWVPFDPTAKVPGYAEIMAGSWDGTGEHDYGEATRPPETTPPETTTELTTTPTEATMPEMTTADDLSEDTTTEPEDDTPGGVGGSGGGGGAGTDWFAVLLPYLVAAAIAGAVIALIAMFLSGLKRGEKKVFRSFRRMAPTEASALMYRFILTLLEKKGIKPEYEQFYDFAERVDGSPEMKGVNVFMMDVMPVFEKCEFGNAEVSPVTEEERTAVYRYTTAVYSKIMGDLSPLKRFFVKISLFL